MQATVVMLIALGGLGCQNPASDLPPIPAVGGEVEAPSSESTAPAPAPAITPYPSGYPAYGVSPILTGDIPEDNSFRGCVRSTVWSFIIGRDPDVPSAREIEAAYYGGQHGH